jgi:hypothetical protein
MSFENEDPFKGIEHINKNAYDDGYSEGEISGKKEAIKQGFKTGQQIAFKVGVELGQYFGTCEMFLTNHSDLKEQQRGIKLAMQINEMISTFEMSNCQDSQFEANLNTIRNKYKQFCSLTHSRSPLDDLKKQSPHINF